MIELSTEDLKTLKIPKTIALLSITIKVIKKKERFLLFN